MNEGRPSFVAIALTGVLAAFFALLLLVVIMGVIVPGLLLRATGTIIANVGQCIQNKLSTAMRWLNTQLLP